MCIRDRLLSDNRLTSMNNSIVTDDEVREFYLNCSSHTIIETLIGLHDSLRLYSQNHGILPNRIFKKLDEGNEDANISHIFMPVAVSYTHLDVYKRQTIRFSSSSPVLLFYVFFVCCFFFLSFLCPSCYRCYT